MPIRYEPMQAADTKIAEAYGAAQARADNRDFSLRAQSVANEQSARMSALAQADEHFNAQLNDQRGRAVMQEDASMARQASGQSFQEHMAGVQAQYESTKLNQMEDMRRQRLERQVDYVRANTGPPESGKRFTPQDGADMEAELRTGLNPLHARLQRSQVLHQEAQTAQVQHTNAMAATIDKANEDHRAGASYNRIKRINGIRHQWSYRQGEWVPMTGAAATAGLGGAGGGGGGTGGGGGMTAAQIDQSLSRGGGAAGGEPVTPPTAEQIVARGAVQQDAAEQLSRREHEARIRTPGGPMPFDAVPQGTTTGLNHTRFMEQNLNEAIEAAEDNDQNNRSQNLRHVASRIRGGLTTGQLTPEEQSLLPNYYRGDFTPALDRELGRIETPRRHQVGLSTVDIPVAPAMLSAAGTIRNTLGHYRTMEAISANPAALKNFNEALATIRVFNWGDTQEEAQQHRRSPNDPPVRPGLTREQREQERRARLTPEERRQEDAYYEAQGRGFGSGST